MCISSAYEYDSIPHMLTCNCLMSAPCASIGLGLAIAVIPGLSSDEKQPRYQTTYAHLSRTGNLSAIVCKVIKGVVEVLPAPRSCPS